MTDVPFVPVFDPLLPLGADVSTDELYTPAFDYLTSEELDILLFMGAATRYDGLDTQTSYSFQGIRRKTQLHPQKATRAIKRLLEKGMIRHRSSPGYAVTEPGKKTLSKVLKYLHPQMLFPDGNFTRAWASFSTNASFDLARVVKELKGKWRGDMRYVSYTNGDNFVIIDWIDETGTVHAAMLLTSGHRMELAVVSPTKVISQCHRDQLANWLQETLGQARKLMLVATGDDDSYDYKTRAHEKLRAYYR